VAAKVEVEASITVGISIVVQGIRADGSCLCDWGFIERTRPASDVPECRAAEGVL
jgi:hypothetical protein